MSGMRAGIRPSALTVGVLGGGGGGAKKNGGGNVEVMGRRGREAGNGRVDGVDEMAN